MIRELCEQAVQSFRQVWQNLGTEGESLRVIRFWGGHGNPARPANAEPTVVVASIQTTGKLEDDVRAKLDGALDAFAQVFQPSKRLQTEAA